MDIQAHVKKELHKIHRSRNRIGYFPNIASLLLSIFFQRQELLLDFRWYVVVALMVAGTFIRVVMNEIFFKEWQEGVPWSKICNWLGFLCLSVSWGLHFADVYHHYGGLSSNVTYTLLVLVAFMTSASNFNVGDKVAYYIFVLGISSIVSITYFLDAGQPHSYIILNVIVYLGFSMANYRISTKQLCELLEAKIRSHAEKENLKKIIDTVPGFVGLIDRNLVCYMANQSTISMFPGIVGTRVGEVDPGSSWEKFISDFMTSTKKAEVAEHHTHIQGKNMSALINVQKMEDGGAIIVSIITTELVEARNKIREQEAKAYYASKLASLGEMAAGIAHEVNNPLAIIQGSANILKKIIDQEPVDVPMVKTLTTKMIETSERISKTVRSLKALSRNGVNDPMTSVSIDKVIQQCLDVSQARCKNSEIDIRYFPASEDIKVKGREVELAQVIINLLINAVDAVSGLPEKWVEIRVMSDNRNVNVFVVDSGTGIPESIRDKIMNPFFTTKDVNQGTGLGLSISKNIIASHEGELTLSTEEPHTTFRIRLPRENA